MRFQFPAFYGLIFFPPGKGSGQNCQESVKTNSKDDMKSKKETKIEKNVMRLAGMIPAEASCHQLQVRLKEEVCYECFIANVQIF